MLALQLVNWTSAVLAGLAVSLLGLTVLQLAGWLWQRADSDRALAWRQAQALAAESSARRRAARARVGLVDPELLVVRQSWLALLTQGRAAPYLAALTAGGGALLTAPAAPAPVARLVVGGAGLAVLLWALLAARRPLLRLHGTRALVAPDVPGLPTAPGRRPWLHVPLAAVGGCELRGGGRWLILSFNQPAPWLPPTPDSRPPQLVLDLALADADAVVRAAELLPRLAAGPRGECRDD